LRGSGAEQYEEQTGVEIAAKIQNSTHASLLWNRGRIEPFFGCPNAAEMLKQSQPILAVLRAFEAPRGNPQNSIALQMQHNRFVALFDELYRDPSVQRMGGVRYDFQALCLRADAVMVLILTDNGALLLPKGRNQDDGAQNEAHAKRRGVKKGLGCMCDQEVEPPQ